MNHATRLMLTAIVLIPAASAADLAKIDRKLAKEPTYQGKPAYCLMVFGPEAQTPVWLVLDGDRLYVDRDGDGDLTESGELIKVKSPDTDPAGFEETELTVGDVKRKLGLHVYGWFDYRQGKRDRLEPSVTVVHDGKTYGAWGDGDSGVVWSDRPQDAPILHVGGPLQMGFESRTRWAFRKKAKDTIEVAVGVGTPGLGKGTFTHLKYWNDAIPEKARPTAVLEFPSRTPDGPPVRIEQVLKEKC
jgi:hypothetical protein